MNPIVLVKVGGDVLLDAQQRQGLGQNIAALRSSGRQVVVIHGAGPQANALQQRLGIEINKVGGRRITDAATLQVMKFAQAGEVSVDLVSNLVSAGLPALGVAGVSAGLVLAKKRPARIVSGCGPDPVDFGLVGDVVKINSELIQSLLKLDLIPVIASLGADANGQAYNINADVVANAAATALKAESLVLVTAVGGIFKDLHDPASRLSALSPDQARAAIADGTIQGGMIPKVEESLKAMQQGLGSTLIIDVASKDGILQALESPGHAGTLLFLSQNSKKGTEGF